MDLSRKRTSNEAVDLSRKRPATEAESTEEIPKMSYSELTDLAPVGQGGYGVVYRANCGRFGTVAFKELNIQILGKRSHDALKKETKMFTLNHVNIVTLLAIILEIDHNGIVMEYVLHGALDDYIYTYDVICEKLGGGGYVSGYQVPMEKKVLMTIWTMANQEPYRTIGDRFGMNRGTAHRCVIEVTTAIRQHLYDEYIVWPTTLEMCSRNAQMFEGKYGFPGCVGCVDGSHIPMKPPANDRDSYINRKGYASVNLMAVCDQKMSFIATYAERAGSVHDARVFRVCDVGQKAARNELFPSTEFHLLGDSAYALMMQVMVPYRDNGHLTAGQKKYNVRHSATRSVIERAFGRLKGKFRRLKGLDVSRTEFAPMFIESACILHNVILQHEENEEEDDHIDNAEEVPEEWCEDELAHRTTDSQAQCNSAERNRAKQKRDEIMNNLL